jgi:predicted HicB family RNase H-like nuclease
VNAPLEYKSYLGSAEVDVEDRVLVGRLLFIRDVITYSATNVAALDAAFREAVDDYLAACEKDGSQPEVPCKGSFNVRVGPDRHRALALAARRNNIGLNDFVCDALDAAIESEKPKSVVHKHEVTVTVVGEPIALTATAGKDPRWETIQ